MFNNGKPEINYIGNINIYVPGIIHNSTLFPISNLDSIIDKALIFKVMTNQYLKFVSQNKSLSGYKPLSKFKVDGPFSFEIEVSDGFRKGNIVLEIVDEAKLRENKDFLESQI